MSITKESSNLSILLRLWSLQKSMIPERKLVTLYIVSWWVYFLFSIYMRMFVACRNIWEPRQLRSTTGSRLGSELIFPIHNATFMSGSGPPLYLDQTCKPCLFDNVQNRGNSWRRHLFSSLYSSKLSPHVLPKKICNSVIQFWGYRNDSYIKMG